MQSRLLRERRKNCVKNKFKIKESSNGISGMCYSFQCTGTGIRSKTEHGNCKESLKKLLSNSKYPYGAYTLYDINRDGVPEMFFEYMSGARSGFKIYTYKKKKVVSVKSSTGISCIYYNSGKKQICILTSSGASDNTYTCYKLSGKKLKKVVQYKSVSSGSGMKFYKNKTRISGNQYMSYVGTFDNWNTVRAH